LIGAGGLSYDVVITRHITGALTGEGLLSSEAEVIKLIIATLTGEGNLLSATIPKYGDR